MTYPIISADSHVTEPPNAYLDNIDPKCWAHHTEKTERDRQLGLLGRNRSRGSP